MALSPLPARPPKSLQAEPVTVNSEPSPETTAAATPELTQAAVEPVQSDASDASDAGMQSSLAAPKPEPAPLPGRNSHSADEPDWQHLAYRPAAVTPLYELPAGFYTVQIVAMSSMEALESFRKEHRLGGVLGARLEAGGKIYYALLLGIYETRADANAAAASRPGSLQHVEPWIRKLGPLQDAVVRADMLANSGGN